jgi:hypothetical protein
MTVIDTENGTTLYERTGEIKDANTLLVNRAELRRLLPWWRKAAICWGNYRRFRRFRLNM